MDMIGNVFNGGSSPTTKVFELDAGISSSYSGSGQTWANLVASPADGAAQTDYDFWLGDGSAVSNRDPIFNGTAGNDSTNDYFDCQSPTGFGLFSQKVAPTTFINSLYKNNAVFSFYAFVRLPSTLTNGFLGLFGNWDGTAAGAGLFIRSDRKLSFEVGNSAGSNQVVATSNDVLSGDTNYFIAMSYTESTGEGLLYFTDGTNASATGFTQSYTSPYSSNKTDGFGVCVANSLNAGTSLKCPKVWRLGMFNTAITFGQIRILFNLYKYKMGL